MALAESFATIVGLISQFRSERDSVEQSDINDFMIWLEQSNFQEIKNLLEQNAKTTTYIKSILNQDRDVLKQQLERIDAALIAFASSIEGFSELAKSISPNSVLSDQAIDILRQFEESGASKMSEMRVMGGSLYQYVETDGNLDYSDTRFIEDDLNTLVDYGLLRHEHNSQGSNVYIYTRVASDLVRGNNS